MTNKRLAKESKEIQKDEYLAYVSIFHETACLDLQRISTLPQ